MICRRIATVNLLQAATSASVRPQPLHSPNPLSISHTCTQGVSIAVGETVGL